MTRPLTPEERERIAIKLLEEWVTNSEILTYDSTLCYMCGCVKDGELLASWKVSRAREAGEDLSVIGKHDPSCLWDRSRKLVEAVTGKRLYREEVER